MGADRPHRIVLAAALLALLASPPAPADAPTLEGRVVDEAGAPHAGAVLHLHGTREAARTDARGRFALPHPQADDVLAVAVEGQAQAFHHVAADFAGPMEVVVPRAPPVPERVDVVTQTRDLPLSLALAGVPLAGASAESLTFRVDEGARALRIHADWTPNETAGSTVNLFFQAVPPDPEAPSLWRTGNAPLDFALPHSLLARHPGDWELRMRPADAAASDVRVSVTVAVEYGPPQVKRVHGRPPQATDDADAGTRATMDVLGAAFSNETPDALEVEVRLTQAGTLAPTTLPYAHWVALWRQDDGLRFVAATARRGATDDAEPPRFSAGDCASTCAAAFDVTGLVEPGSPGALRILVAKDQLRLPPDGGTLEGLRAFAYESAEPYPTFPASGDPPLTLDATAPGASYVVGAHEYDVPPEVLAAFAPTGIDLLRAAALQRAPALAPWVGGFAFALAGAVLVLSTRRRAPAPVYDPIRTLGKGATGRVVLARHRVLNRHVAIKETWQDGDEARERVLREARTLARLGHENVVRVLDVLEEPRGPRIVMEYVAGGSLEARLRPGEPLPLDEALRAWRDVLRGLDAAHAVGIVHRDVKPANVLLTPEGTAKLGDFGLARAVAEPTLGGDGAAPAGTPSYMAPEQIRGEPPTPASDVFAAGALAYRLLSGRALVDAAACRNPWDVLVARQTSGPALPLRDVPQDVNAVLAACLENEPDRRPTAAEALRALDALREPRR